MKKDTKEVVKVATFNKTAILKSEKYASYRDLLTVLLDENEEYTLEVVDAKINDFMKGEVD